MTDTESRLDSALFDALIRFLRKPVIKLELCPSHEIEALQTQIQLLMEQQEEQNKRYEVLENKYCREVGLNIRYEDMLRAAGIRFQK